MERAREDISREKVHRGSEVRELSDIREKERRVEAQRKEGRCVRRVGGESWSSE